LKGEKVMKFKKDLIKIALLTVVVSFIAGVAIAGDDMTTITGMVEQTDAGLVIKTADGNFATAGADLATMVGKKVEAMGKVSEGDAGPVFNVVSIKEVQE